MKFRLNLSMKTKIAAGALFGGGLLCSPAYSALLEEIVVTAQKREQNLQDVGDTTTLTFISDYMVMHKNYKEDMDATAITIPH